MHFRISSFTPVHRAVSSRLAWWGAIMCGVVTSVAAPQAVSEQVGGATDAKLEEVVVSAARSGEQSLQRVPMAVSALDPDAFALKGGASLDDLAREVPSLTVNQRVAGQNQITLRGLVTGYIDIFNGFSERPLVALYLDDTSLAVQGFSPELKTYELERVEVLRGPQGTLYGASSMSGAIRYITRKPSTTQFSASTEVIGSSTEHGSENYSVKGTVNVPLVEGLAGLTLSAYNGFNSGYIDNIARDDHDINWDRATQARASLRITPSDRLTVDAGLFYSRLDTGGTNLAFSNLGHYQYSSAVREPTNNDLLLANLTLGFDFDAASIVSSTSYTKRSMDLEITNEYLLERYFFSQPNDPGISLNYNDIEDFSQEVRATSRQEGSWRWSLGAYYNHTKRKNFQNTTTPGFDARFGELTGDPTFSSVTWGGITPNTWFYGTNDSTESHVAVFGELTYLPVESLQLTAGLRAFDWRYSFSTYNGGLVGALGPNEPLLGQHKPKKNGVNPRFVASYEVTDNLMVYAEASRGFRFGGANSPVPDSFCSASLAEEGMSSAPLTFEPDYLWSYSIGEKATLAQGRLRLNVAAFLVTWSDVQTVHRLSCSYSFTQNAGRITSKGVELEATARLLPDLTVTFGGAYTNAEAHGAIPNVGAEDGDPVPFAPKYMASVSADYLMRLSNQADVRYTLGYQYRGESATRFSPTSPLYRDIPSFGNVDASIVYQTERWDAGLFARNLTDEAQISLIQANDLGTYPGDRYSYLRPRTIGLRGVFRF